MNCMIKTTTQSDLVLYAYNENGLSESDRIQRSIDGDPLVQQEFNEIVEAIHSIDEIKLEPSDQSIAKILAYSKSSKA
jgi:hypothetical protein